MTKKISEGGGERKIKKLKKIKIKKKNEKKENLFKISKILTVSHFSKCSNLAALSLALVIFMRFLASSCTNLHYFFASSEKTLFDLLLASSFLISFIFEFL